MKVFLLVVFTLCYCLSVQAQTHSITLRDNWYCIKYGPFFIRDSTAVFVNSLNVIYNERDSCKYVSLLASKKRNRLESWMLMECGEPGGTTRILSGKYRRTAKSRNSSVYKIVGRDMSGRLHQWLATVYDTGNHANNPGSANRVMRLEMKKTK